MKKRLKNFILAVVFVIVAAFGAACASSSSIDDIVEEYPIRVTLDFNGGAYGTETSRRIQVKENSLLLEPSSSQSVYKQPERAGYTLEGYYRGTKDENGNVTFGTKWNFATDRVTEDITLYARWQNKIFLVVKYVCGEEALSEKQINVNTDTYSTSRLNTVIPEKYKGYTLQGFYSDAACTTPVGDTIDFTGATESVVIYASFTKDS